jgi:hypothetical protein
MNSTGRSVVGFVLALGMAAPAAAQKKTVSPESIKEDLIAAHCKAEAKKYYSIVQLQKRRAYEKNCIERARR